MSSSKNTRMGGLGKLSDFGQTKPAQTPAQEIPTEVLASPSLHNKRPVTAKKKKAKPSEVLTTVNIKIRRDQHQWLSDTARQVRDNNLDPVPPSDRVYPQHLIGVAIEILKSKDLDWSQIKTIEELQRQLNL